MLPNLGFPFGDCKNTIVFLFRKIFRQELITFTKKTLTRGKSMNKTPFLLAALVLSLIAGCQIKAQGNDEDTPGTQVDIQDYYKADLSTLEGQWRDSVHTSLAGILKDKKIVMGQYTMPIWWKIYGEEPAGGRSLYISLHGGGGTTAEMNDGQWENQKKLYEPAEGVYLCPRAITNTWDLHFRPESDAFYEKIIQLAVTCWNVNPNKVYLMGYSAGGDGVWRLAPRMADHWAAASMMAGHPGDVSLLSLRNLPFMIWCGALDDAYDRNKVCAERIEEMNKFQEADPEGYFHEGHIVAGKPHWMDLVDAAAVPWMAKYTRNPYPKKVVWCQGDVMKEYFYWLGIPVDEAEKGNKLTASIEGNTVNIGDCDYSKVRIFLNDKLVDLSKPVIVTHGEEKLFEGILTPSDALRKRTLYTRNDPAYSFPCVIEVSF